jgi:hypothetical protein
MYSTSTIKTAEKELEIALAQYRNTYISYSQDASTGFSKKAAAKLQKLRVLNNYILKLIMNLEEQNQNQNQNQSYDYKKIHKVDVEFTNVQLIQMAETLQRDDKKIKKMLNKLEDIDGEKENTELQVSVSYYHYIYYTLSFIIVSFFLLRAFVTDDSTSVENVILVVAILLLVFHFGGGLINSAHNFVYAHNLI